MLEGALIWNNTHEENHEGSNWYIGQDMYSVFRRLTARSTAGERPDFLRPIEDILDGRVRDDTKEHGIGKWRPASHYGISQAHQWP